MNQTDEQLTVFSDYVCPFCYLGRRSLETYQERRDGELGIDWHPYDLRRGKRGPDGEIDHSIEDGKDEAYFEQVRQNVNRLKEEYDAEEMLNLEDLPDTVDSFNAQLASFYVKREHPEHWLAFDEAIFETLWLEGRDIGDVEILIDLARSVGLDGDEIAEALADETLEAALQEQFSDAHQAGITGVPTFTYEGHVARGAVPPAQLERLVEGT